MIFPKIKKIVPSYRDYDGVEAFNIPTGLLVEVIKSPSDVNTGDCLMKIHDPKNEHPFKYVQRKDGSTPSDLWGNMLNDYAFRVHLPKKEV